MKIFMLWDMEGTSGLFEREETWFWEPATREQVAARGKQLLIDDINSACRAALAAGVDEIVVCDTHHGGGNIELDRMLSDPRITYLVQSRGYQDGKYRWMPGLDHTVDAFMVPGHHAKAGTEGAFLPHTSSLEWSDFRINGQSVGEMGLESCFAGHWDVPVAMAQGDEAGCAEALEQFPGIVTVPVKRALSRDYCTGLSPEAAHLLMVEKMAEAVEAVRTGKAKPFKTSLPMTVTIRMRTIEGAEKAAARPRVRRVDDHTVEGIVEQQADVLEWITGDGLDIPPRARP